MILSPNAPKQLKTQPPKFIQQSLPPSTSPWQNLQSQPHRLFFFFGVAQGILFIVLLGLTYAGLITLQTGIGFYHAYAMAFIVFTQFFAGFLLTVFSRYLAQPPTPKATYLPIAWSLNSGSLLFTIALFLSEKAMLLGMIVIAVAFATLTKTLFQTYRASRVGNKNDTFWMIVAFACGLAAQCFFMLSLFFPLDRLAIDVSFYLYLFFIVINVSQKMMPFFTANTIIGYQINKSRYFLESIFIALVLKVLLETFEINAWIADSALFSLITYELLKWRLPFAKAPSILWVLFLSIWWVPLAFALFLIQDFSALFHAAVYLEKSPLHTLALGYFTTILIGFGTRIILGHSGRQPHADAYALTLFGLIQLMTLLRILAGIFPQIGYQHAILSVAGLWIIIFGMWAKRYIGILFEK